MKIELNNGTYYVHLPKNIYEDLKQVISEQKEIQLDSAVLIINFILKLKFRDKNYEGGKEYVALNSKILEKYDKNYKKVLEFLRENDFIEYTNSYRNGKSRLFKIVDKYFIPSQAKSDLSLETGLVKHLFEDNLKNSNRAKINQSKRAQAQYRNTELTKWLSTTNDSKISISIESDKAIAYVKEKYVNDEFKLLKRLYDIQKVIDKDIQFSREGDDDRFHSNFTNMSSDVKQFIKYDGKDIKEIDIKSAQPVLISIVFNKLLNVFDKCYSNLPSKDIRTNKDINLLKRELKKGIRVILYKFINKNVIDNVIDLSNYIDSITIMFSKFLLSLDNTEYLKFKNEVQDFIELVKSGEYYEVLGKQLFEGGVIDEVVDIETGELLYQFIKYDKKSKKVKLTEADTLRNTGKAIMLNVIYMPAHEKKSKVINYFREINPSIALLLKIMMLDTKDWSDKSHRKFPILIQQIEAKFILDYCVKKVAKKYPEMPLITIHDSVSTTIEWFAQLEEEFKRHLKDYFGFEVETGQKPWKKNSEEQFYRVSA